ncbi:NUDIX domain-containing protein [Nonomuraea sp. NPDC049758]|uniref:NUDIX hydrolase n=1 Tax=Nonomuraea sp. NPDC049758 TaxID=3154360 RepID=UPI003422113B
MGEQPQWLPPLGHHHLHAPAVHRRRHRPAPTSAPGGQWAYSNTGYIALGLLVEQRAYGIRLQPGGHLEPADTSLIDAAVRELAEETGIDPAQVMPASQTPVYVEYARVPARPQKGEPAHHHLDIGYAFVTHADLGPIQESEVTDAAWYPLGEAERLVGPRIARAVPARD